MQGGRKRSLSVERSPEAENLQAAAAGGKRPPSAGIAPAECQAWLERAGLLELAQQALPGAQQAFW